jgi:Uma2 family endonuclease
MVAEVADTSLMTDRTLKGRICARAGIPVYWIINLTTGALEMYANPSRDSEPSYRERTTFTSGQYVAVIIEEKAVGQIAVRDLLP